MRIFVYEYLCAGGLTDHPAARSLRAEGRAMLHAILADLGQVPGVEAVSFPDGATSSSSEAPVFRQLARTADYSLVIAPEFDRILATRCRWVEEAGGRLLGPGVEAVELTGDKLRLGRHLQSRGVPTPPCYTAAEFEAAPSFPAVVKPRDGAGSQATFLVRGAGQLAACSAQAREEGGAGEAVVQPFVPGRPASVALILGPGQLAALPPAEQLLSDDGRFRYRGGALPLPPALAGRAQRLALRAAAAVTGLQGYVGVDLVLGGAADGSQDSVIEINPRLTTSYVGLRALARTNLAAVLLAVVRGEAAPPVGWHAGAVRFTPGGTVCRCDGRPA
jgi:predicted ATP-grasp superfamily ATP-dependent carboligase